MDFEIEGYVEKVLPVLFAMNFVRKKSQNDV